MNVFAWTKRKVEKSGNICVEECELFIFVVKRALNTATYVQTWIGHSFHLSNVVNCNITQFGAKKGCLQAHHFGAIIFTNEDERENKSHETQRA